MEWVTRENAKLARIARPCLLGRIIDRDAEFLHVPAGDVLAEAREGATAYDMPGSELGHLDGCSSFESILLMSSLAADSALVALGRIVHTADIAADIGTASEADGAPAAKE